jgi:hypothetical protein
MQSATLYGYPLLWVLTLCLAIFLLRVHHRIGRSAGRLLAAVAAGTAPHILFVEYINYLLQSNGDLDEPAALVEWYERNVYIVHEWVEKWLEPSWLILLIIALALLFLAIRLRRPAIVRRGMRVHDAVGFVALALTAGVSFTLLTRNSAPGWSGTLEARIDLARDHAADEKVKVLLVSSIQTQLKQQPDLRRALIRFADQIDGEIRRNGPGSRSTQFSPEQILRLQERYNFPQPYLYESVGRSVAAVLADMTIHEAMTSVPEGAILNAGADARAPPASYDQVVAFEKEARKDRAAAREITTEVLGMLVGDGISTFISGGQRVANSLLQNFVSDEAGDISQRLLQRPGNSKSLDAIIRSVNDSVAIINGIVDAALQRCVAVAQRGSGGQSAGEIRNAVEEGMQTPPPVSHDPFRDRIQEIIIRETKPARLATEGR